MEKTVTKRLSERIENWKKSLLDMTKRNRLLYYKPFRVGSVQVTDELFDETIMASKAMRNLLNGGTWTFELECAELDELEDVEGQNELSGLGREDFVRKRTKSLANIMKKDKLENDEKGLSIGYLAIGFLKWYEREDAEDEIRTPLVMVPIKITQDNRKAPFVVALNPDEEIALNPVILKKLHDDFGFEIDSSKASVEENQGKSVDTYDEVMAMLENVREAVRTQVRWGVLDEAVIDTFMFHNLAIWNDLDKNPELVSESPFGQILAGAERTEVGIEYDEQEIDLKHRESKEDVCILETDSSQMEAICRAKNGESFVIQGPPGTGKSQTITNIIAEQLFLGKKVLFVSEKQAALDVVYHKLEQHGLADFCLIMHNAKQKKMDVREQLQRSLELVEDRRRMSEKEKETYQKLDEKVRKLNLYDEKLHEKCENGMTMYEIFGKMARLEDAEDLNFEWPEEISLNMEFQKIEEIFRVVDDYAKSFGDDTRHFDENYWRFYAEDFDNTTRRKVEDVINDFGMRRVESLVEGFSEVKADTLDVDDTLRRADECRAAFELLPFEQAKTDTLVERTENVKVIRNEIDALESEIRAYKNNTKQSIEGFREEIENDEEEIKQKTKEIQECFTDDFFVLEKVEDLYKKLQNKFGKFYQRWSQDYKKLVGQLEEMATVRMKYRSYIIYLGKRLEIDRLKNEVQNIQKKITDTEKTAEVWQQKTKKKLDDKRAKFVQVVGDLGVVAEQQMDNVKDLLEKLDFEKMSEYANYHNMRQMLEKLELQRDFVRKIEDAGKRIEAGEIGRIFRKRFYRLYVEQTDFGKRYYGYLSAEHDEDVNVFRKYDEEAREIAASRIRQKLIERIPDLSGFNNKRSDSEVGLLRRELKKKARLMPTRKLIEGLPVVLPQLKPCMMMSPLTVSSYFGTNKNWKFDVVIFDEASQVRSEYAVPSIVRGKQIIIAGDAKQMPPTRFFDVTGDVDGGYNEMADDVVDLESILDEMSAKLPDKTLNWHYRSKDESLIAFSNNKFYNSRLHTFPSARKDDKNLGVKFVYCKDGVWENKNGNRNEAEEVARIVFEYAKKFPDDSLGVVAFGKSQETAIQIAVDKIRDMHPEIEEFFSEMKDEPFFIKNLENVQGDERDHIILSCGYGKDADGKFAMRFGPLAMAGGERRLNVAVSRAKKLMTVVSSFRANEIREADENHKARKLIRDFVDYAERGPKALLGDDEDQNDEVPEFDSEFEEDVYDFLRSQGYNVKTQVGASGFRIDIGVLHPEIEGRFVLAVECDGAAYHSSLSARDRDILRQEILENLGWRFYRIWSTNWINDNVNEKRKLAEAVEKAIKEYNKPFSGGKKKNRIPRTHVKDLELEGFDELKEEIKAIQEETRGLERQNELMDWYERLREKVQKSWGTNSLWTIFDVMMGSSRWGGFVNTRTGKTLKEILLEVLPRRNGFAPKDVFREINDNLFLKNRLTERMRSVYEKAFYELVKEGRVELVNGSIRYLG